MQASRILPDLQCSILCEEVRQEVTGNLFLIGVIDAIRVPQLPVVAFRLMVFNRWTAGVGQFVETVRLLAPDQSVIVKTETRFAMKDPYVNATSVSVLQQVEFKAPGAHFVEVLVDNVLKVRYPVHVILVQVPGQPQPQPAPQAPTGGTATGG
jgi:hypothetical protein